MHNQIRRNEIQETRNSYTTEMKKLDREIRVPIHKNWRDIINNVLINQLPISQKIQVKEALKNFYDDLKDFCSGWFLANSKEPSYSEMKTKISWILQWNELKGVLEMLETNEPILRRVIEQQRGKMEKLKQAYDRNDDEQYTEALDEAYITIPQNTYTRENYSNYKEGGVILETQRNQENLLKKEMTNEIEYILSDKYISKINQRLRQTITENKNIKEEFDLIYIEEENKIETILEKYSKKGISKKKIEEIRIMTKAIFGEYMVWISESIKNWFISEEERKENRDRIMKNFKWYRNKLQPDYSRVEVRDIKKTYRPFNDWDPIQSHTNKKDILQKKTKEQMNLDIDKQKAVAECVDETIENVKKYSFIENPQKRRQVLGILTNFLIQIKKDNQNPWWYDPSIQQKYIDRLRLVLLKHSEEHDDYIIVNGNPRNLWENDVENIIDGLASEIKYNFPEKLEKISEIRYLEGKVNNIRKYP